MTDLINDVLYLTPIYELRHQIRNRNCQDIGNASFLQSVCRNCKRRTGTLKVTHNGVNFRKTLRFYFSNDLLFQCTCKNSRKKSFFYILQSFILKQIQFFSYLFYGSMNCVIISNRMMAWNFVFIFKSINLIYYTKNITKCYKYNFFTLHFLCKYE